MPVVLIAGLLTFIALFGAARIRKFETVVLSVFAATSFGIFLIFAIITFNQPGTGLALLALSLLLDFAALVQFIAARRAIYVLSVLPLIIAATIQIEWTSMRYVNDFDQASLGSSVDGATISSQLAHLRWAIPSNHPGERNAAHYRELLTSLRGRSTPAVIISDSVLEPLTGQHPVAPNLIWQEILGLPNERFTCSSDVRQSIQAAIVAAHSDLVVMDGPHTWAGTKRQLVPMAERLFAAGSGKYYR